MENWSARSFRSTLYNTNVGVLTQAWRIPFIRRNLVARLKQDKTQVVIDLMPHIWSPLVVPAIRRAGARYIAVVHDADPHPGDLSSVVATNNTLKQADQVIALSSSVAERLTMLGRVPPEKVTILFFPDLNYVTQQPESRKCVDPPQDRGERAKSILTDHGLGKPMRLFFLGRILRYKGFSLFLDTVDQLRADGISLTLGAFGEGSLGNHGQRLEEMGTEVVDRWLSEDEFGDILQRHDVLVASHTEASQSGVVASALSAGLPVVVTPIGGLVGQVSDGETGIVARAANAPSLADAIKRLFFTPGLYRKICRNVEAGQSERSMARFVHECVMQSTAAPE